jgi:GNAT superfamily N-acetyltransferase
MVAVYSQLDGFPKESERPNNYKMLANIGKFTSQPDTQLLVAVSSENKIAGALVYFSAMQYYGFAGTASKEQNASGFRLLGVDPLSRKQGIATLLILECIAKAKENKHSQMIIHRTKAMKTAWKMYEDMGFKRAEDLDFMQGDLPVFWI